MVPDSLEIDGIFIKLSKKKMLRMNNPEYIYLALKSRFRQINASGNQP